MVLLNSISPTSICSRLQQLSFTYHHHHLASRCSLLNGDLPHALSLVLGNNVVIATFAMHIGDRSEVLYVSQERIHLGRRKGGIFSSSPFDWLS